MSAVVQQRVELVRAALARMESGDSLKEVAEALGTSHTTLFRRVRDFREGGEAALAPSTARRGRYTKAKRAEFLCRYAGGEDLWDLASALGVPVEVARTWIHAAAQPAMP